MCSSTLITYTEVNMFQLDLKSKKSIYEQIVDGIKAMIISGEYSADEKLPSVRDLSAQLTVNPNTIQKAFKALEQQGWIYTVTGRGCFVSESAKTIDRAQTAHLFDNIANSVKELLYLGLSIEEIQKIVDDMIMKGGN